MIPVPYEGRVVACLNISSRSLDRVSDIARTALETIAAQIGNVIMRSKAEEALLASEARLKRFHESDVAGFARTRVGDGKLLTANDYLVKLLGYEDRETCLKQYIGSEHCVDSDARKQMLIQLKETGHARNLELPITRRNGAIIWVTYSAVLYPEEDYIEFVVLDVTERKQAEEQIKASLKEKEVLLSEIHRRVKNNMQIIISLLRLQAGKVKDKKYADLLKDSRDRIQAMALIHEKLYRTKDFTSIDFDQYIKSLARDLFRSYGVDPNRIAMKIRVEGVSLGLDNGIPCGLVINELVSNSLKHAFPQDRRGEIMVALRSTNGDGDDLELRVGDNGVGLPEDLDVRNTESLGLRIVTILAARSAQWQD